MPSHIFSTLGLWQEVIGSDRASDEVTLAYTARVNPQAAPDPAANPARYHSLDFLTNAYLQLGQDQQAKRIVDARNSVTEYPANFRYSGHTALTLCSPQSGTADHAAHAVSMMRLLLEKLGILSAAIITTEFVRETELYEA